MSESTNQHELREVIRVWLESVKAKTGLAYSTLAKKAGVTGTTLTNFMNKPDYTHIPNSTTIAKIARYAKVPMPSSYLPEGLVLGFAEPEVRPWDGEDPSGPGAPVANGNQDWWEIRSRVLDLAGYLPGDKVLVDLTEKPRPGDIVIAQVYSQSGEAETVFRRYEPPFLTARGTMENQPKPILLDYEKVSVMGTVIAALRERRKLSA